MSKWLGKRFQSSEQGYWQTIADALAALLLVVLLVLMLLMLYIVRTKTDDYVDYHSEDFHVEQNASNGVVILDDDDSDSYLHTDDVSHSDSSGGGGGGYDEPGKEFEPGSGEDELNKKAAIYVMVIDGETDRTIKEAGIQFELYSDGNTLQILNTYYPQKIEFRNFHTTDAGVFYLPEKVEIGSYHLHEMNVPEGYDEPENLSIDIYEAYDWPEPYIAKVLLYPSRNTIRIKMIDADSGNPVSGGVYDVIAAEDIITKDGTLRYHQGETVDQITCGNNGSGESIPLFLGNYLLQQSTVPMWYAADTETATVSVEKKHGNMPSQQNEKLCQKTTVTLRVSDELYPERPITEAVFTMTRDGHPTEEQTLTVNEFGELTMTNLEKNTTYRLIQIQTKDGFSKTTDACVFSVSSQGLVENEVQHKITVPNRTIRASFCVKDIITQSMVSDYSIALYDSSNNLISVWDSSAIAQVVEGLTVGDYYIQIGGREESRKHILLQDIGTIQPFQFTVWTATSILAVVFLGLTSSSLLILLSIRVIRRKMKNKLPERISQ